jgi:cold shock protein
MPVGKIKKLVQEKGFGFISPQDGEDVFFHHSSVENRQFENLSVGQAVEFQIDSTPNPKGKGPRASSVTPV